MPKILIFGGVPNSIINFRAELIDEWLKLGYKVTAVTAEADKYFATRFQEMRISFFPVPLKRGSLNLFADLKTMFAFNRIIKTEKPDLVFAYTVKPIVLSGLLLYFNKKLVLYALITGLGYAFAGQTARQRFAKGLLRVLYRLALKKSAVVFFQNRDDLDLFLNHGIVSEQQRLVKVNGSGVNTNHYYFSKIKHDDIPVFLLIARMIKSKGVKVFVDAARVIKKKYPRAKFVLLGQKSQEPDRIDPTELERWQAEGLVDYVGRQQDVRSYIENSSVFVLPSYYREGVPRSVLEAMSMGRPIITTDSTGCRDTVIDGVNGYLVPVKDSVALAKTMERFILNPALIEEMGLESRRIAEEKFDVRKVNRVILAEMEMGLDIS